MNWPTLPVNKRTRNFVFLTVDATISVEWEEFKPLTNRIKEVILLLTVRISRRSDLIHFKS